MPKTELILVTGGLGFIGKHFVRRCLQEKRYVRNIDKISFGAAIFPLYAAHRVQSGVVIFASIDLILCALFVAAWFKTAGASSS